jgi:hypothetical protein
MNKYLIFVIKMSRIIVLIGIFISPLNKTNNLRIMMIIYKDTFLLPLFCFLLLKNRRIISCCVCVCVEGIEEEENRVEKLLSFDH